MMDKLWLVLFVALAGFYLSYGLPVRSSPETYPHSSHEPANGWSFEAGWYPAIPALALVVTAVGFLLGCTWCFRHKDCKLFSAAAPTFHANQQHQLAETYPEPSNNNISEDNNNGPISFREMQNIANNNAAAYIVSENEERNRVNRDSVVEFVPLPVGIGAVDPLERCADWFAGESFPRSRLQYLREIGRGWFGRVVEGEIEDEGGTSSVAVRILNQTASLEDKARFLDEARVLRDVTHENILPFIAKSLEEDPWILMFELCPMDLQQYLISNRPKMAILNDSGVPLRLMADVSSALAYLHARGHLYRNVSTTNVLVRGEGTNARAVLGAYVTTEPSHELSAPECRRRPPVYTTSSEIWTVGNLIWEVCAWGSAPLHHPPRLPDLPCPYRNHLYQIMQLCWNAYPENRPTAAQVQDLINHLYTTHLHSSDSGLDNDDFEDRWQRLKPNSIPKLDEHIAIVHAPSISNTSNFTTSDQELDNPTTTQDTLSLDLDTAVSRSSSIMSDKDPMSGQVKSESLTNLHGSLEDVRNIYLTHNETAALECHQGNISLEDRDKELDKSDSSMDPWLKEIIAGSQDDVSYYKDVSDVMKNLDNILNSEKTSSSESSHQASPSRDHLSLDCKKEYTMQSSLVKSPGISNFQNILGGCFDSKDDHYADEDADNDTVGTLSHSFERHSDTTSQHTLANLTPETPNKDFEIVKEIKYASMSTKDLKNDIIVDNKYELPNEIVETAKSELPKLNELCQISLNSVSVLNSEKSTNKDCDNIVQERNGTTDIKENESKSVEDREPSIEQLLSEVSLVENETGNNKTLGEKNFSSLPTDKQDSDTYTKNLVMPHRTLNNDIACSELLMQTERNIAVLDLCLSESKQTESGKLGTMPVESQAVPRNKIEKAREVKHILNTPHNSFEAPIHEDLKAVLTAENLEAASPSETVPIRTEEQLKLPQDIFCEIDTTPVDEKKVAIMNNQDNMVCELNLESKIAEKQEKITYSEPTGQINSAHCNSSSLPVSEVSVTNKITTVIDTFQDKSPKTSSELIEALKFINLAENSSTSSDELEEEENFKHSGDHQVLCLKTLENAPAIAENSAEGVIDILKSGLDLSSEEMVQQTDNNLYNNGATESETSPEIVQKIIEEINLDESEQVKFNDSNLTRSDINKKDNLLKQTLEDTVYMDLINNTNSVIMHDDNLDNGVVIPCLDAPTHQGSFTFTNDDSTMYLDLPSRIRETHDFLHSERALSVPDEKFEIEKVLSSSTPEGNSVKVEHSPNAIELTDEARLKLEQKYVDSSPPESPTKSHHTDTYDENSSVVLGPFENNSVGSYHQHRPQGDLVDLPKEELLAFSSNFSEINLETPSPLRDVNFLKEVPDILTDDLQFDDLETISEVKRDLSEPLPLPDSNSSQDETDSQVANEKVSGPLTPPNSPGVFLVSDPQPDPQPKYVVDIDLNPPNPPAENRYMQDEIELNQIELQITSKLAMAENENNMNIEYSGPLVEEGIEPDSLLMYEDDVVPERVLAGNLGAPDQSRPSLSLDEECVQALRNELELKLPLAQVASIEPQADGEWCSELPPPPELIVNYPGALSPIVEETRQQLSAYENDAQWNPATLPDSSESYPEPCNNSTDDVTDISIGNSAVNESTFILCSKSDSNTYTVDKDPSSKKITMSTDSLNGSPLKIIPKETLSPVDDKTYTKKDNEDTNCERISQVSPFLLSPSTDTTIPGSSDNATASSTFVKTFVPSDSKFINTQCLSTATSIDSCCSNDTLYNVEENFDDLAMDPELLPDFDKKDDEFRERRHSYCSTYTIRDDKSDACDTFSPDSISENNYTYTNIARTDIATLTPSVEMKSDKSDKKSNDLAYGTLLSYSNCATEYLSGMDEAWKLPAPELIRKSPIKDEVISTPPRITALVLDKPLENLEITFKPSLNKMDSVEITCLGDNTYSLNKSEKAEGSSVAAEFQDSPEQKSSTPFLTSTPLTDANKETLDLTSSQGPSEICFEVTSPEDHDMALLQTFEDNNTAFLNRSLLEETVEPEKKTSTNSESLAEPVFTYSDFEKSALSKPQHSAKLKDNQSTESGFSSEDFLKSIRERPQDLSSGINASSLLLANERIFALSLSGIDSIPPSQTDSSGTESTLPLAAILPSNPDLNESRVDATEPSNSLFVTDLDNEEETDQPHSIIITDLKTFASEIPDRTYDTHINTKILDTLNSHENTKRLSTNFNEENPSNSAYDSKNLVPNGSAQTGSKLIKVTEANEIADRTCATEYLSGTEEAWKLPAPEVIRKSPIKDEVISTPPRITALVLDKPHENIEIKFIPSLNKMDSVQITCLEDNTYSLNKSEKAQGSSVAAEFQDSPEQKSTTPFLTSTPLTDANKETLDLTSSQGASEICFEVTSPADHDMALLQTFEGNNTAFLDLSLLEERVEAEKKTSTDSASLAKPAFTYSDFEKSALSKPQHSAKLKDNQSAESGVSSEDFLKSIRERPQDLSSGINASSLLLANERIFALSLSGIDSIPLSQTDSSGTESTLPLAAILPNNPDLNESRVDATEPSNSLFVTDLDNEEETDQPHSIIITDFKTFASEIDRAYDTHISKKVLDTFNSHENTKRLSTNFNEENPSNRTYDSKNEVTALGYVTCDNNELSKNLVPNGSAQTGSKLDKVTEVSEIADRTYDSHINEKLLDTFNSHENTKRLSNDFNEENPSNRMYDSKNEVNALGSVKRVNNELSKNLVPNGPAQTDSKLDKVTEANFNGNIQVYATVNFLSDAFEELLESNVDGNDSKSIEEPQMQPQTSEPSTFNDIVAISADKLLADRENLLPNEINGVLIWNKPSESVPNTNSVPEKVVTENFLRNEKNFCRSDSYLPLLSDIRFTGPGPEIMSTSFTQDSPTEPGSPESEKDKQCDPAADILKEWDSDSDNHSSNSSSGEFIWKDGDGNETAVVPSTQFQHQRDGSAGASAADGGTAASEASGDSGSGSEGDEVEFVPSSWDCSAAPSKSSLRSLEQLAPSKKRVVFKRQKYHCVYEYPREVCEVESDSPAAYMPDLSTYCEWDPATAEDAEIGYSQLFGEPNPLDMLTLRSGIAYGADYDEDFFISSSARPFQSLGLMSTSSQFFPGKHVKPSLVERDINDDAPNHFTPTLSPLTTLVQSRTPSLDFTTPDSGVEDITPGSMISEEDFNKKLPEEMATWRPADSGSSSETVSPSSPGGEALGGLRHTRDKLKLDLPPSPHIPSPRHNRVFNFVLDKPKRHRYSDETQRIPEVGTTPLVMTDETPIITTTLPIHDAEEVEVPEPTFSTFGKCVEKNDEAELKCIVLDEVPKTTPESDTNEESNENHVKVETVKGEGTVLDSGDEDSGIESSKATLERNKTPNVS